MVLPACFQTKDIRNNIKQRFEEANHADRVVRVDLTKPGAVTTVAKPLTVAPRETLVTTNECAVVIVYTSAMILVALRLASSCFRSPLYIHIQHLH